MKILNLRYINIKFFKKSSLTFPFTKIFRKPYTLLTSKEEEKILSEIRFKNRKAIYSETESLKDNSVSKKIMNLRKKEEYDFEFLNKLVDDFMSSKENKFNSVVTNHLIEILGYNYFFNSKIKDLLIDMMTTEDENKIFSMSNVFNYVHQINTSRRITLDFPQIFYQNVEKIFLDKGFLLNMKELSNLTRSLLKYNLYINQIFYDYLERCILHNFENKAIRNQSYSKESVANIILRYGSLSSLGFLKSSINGTVLNANIYDLNSIMNVLNKSDYHKILKSFIICFFVMMLINSPLYYIYYYSNNNTPLVDYKDAIFRTSIGAISSSNKLVI